MLVFTVTQWKNKIKTIELKQSRIWACAIFRTQVICLNVSHKFIELSMEMPLLCPSLGHSNGGRKSMKTPGIHFCYKNRSARPLELADIYITLFTIPRLFRLLKIAGWVIFFKHTRRILSAILTSCGVKTPKFKMLYSNYKNKGYIATKLKTFKRRCIYNAQ